eukprot:2261422-Alexandrium_andersonii.AAC.1
MPSGTSAGHTRAITTRPSVRSSWRRSVQGGARQSSLGASRPCPPASRTTWRRASGGWGAACARSRAE